MIFRPVVMWLCCEELSRDARLAIVSGACAENRLVTDRSGDVRCEVDTSAGDTQKDRRDGGDM